MDILTLWSHLLPIKKSCYKLKSKKGKEITIFENNCIPNASRTSYDATFVYLIRRDSKFKIYTDCHSIGLFKLKTWLNLLKESGFNRVNQVRLKHSCDRFVFEKSGYPLRMFVCVKNKK